MQSPAKMQGFFMQNDSSMQPLFFLRLQQILAAFILQRQLAALQLKALGILQSIHQHRFLRQSSIAAEMAGARIDLHGMLGGVQLIAARQFIASGIAPELLKLRAELQIGLMMKKLGFLA